MLFRSEVAYELKDITRYLIASPTEIMAYGYPYKIISEHLFDKADYKSICDGFYNFYSSYTMPYGTIAVTVCSEVEKMAQIMKEINSLYDFDENKIGNIQRLDGYTPIIFYDFGSYVENLCQDSYLLEQFNQQLDKMIPPEYRLSTKSYYCMGKGIVYLNTYSGLNTSEPSYNTKTVAYSESSWYKATH